MPFPSTPLRAPQADGELGAGRKKKLLFAFRATRLAATSGSDSEQGQGPGTAPPTGTQHP